MLLFIYKGSCSVPLNWPGFSCRLQCVLCCIWNGITGLTRRQTKIWPLKAIWSLSWTCLMSAVLECVANRFLTLRHGDMGSKMITLKDEAGWSTSTHAWPKVFAVVLRATKLSMEVSALLTWYNLRFHSYVPKQIRTPDQKSINIYSNKCSH